MVSERRAEAQAYLGWVKAVSLDQSQNQANQFKQVEQIEDLCDGVALFDLLAQIDPDYFKNPHGADPKDNWVLKIGTLKRLYKLMVQYYSEILLCSPQALPAPDLNAIAKSSDEEELCKLCHLAVGIAVHSEKNDQHIAAIQSLSEGDQEQLMNSINEVMTAIRSGQESVVNQEESAKTTDAADEFSERREIDPAQARKLAEEKATLEKVYMQLLEDQRALQTSLDDAVVEKNEAVNDLESYKRQVEESRNEQADALMRQEIERLKLELRRSEDNLAEVENENERLISANEDMKRKVSSRETVSPSNDDSTYFFHIVYPVAG
ncbi:hypothetical protein IE53DRAFT_51455 [Violaceomyces palustris]|uniref:Uncharacterized protein n=1 Tax=Violaceomyces palustris TaxID=1673888 RepID=A0ACD0P040_9BASI|nr:hypothetical protein IE53DRAFT_51455 [Violaceomyces palustris]